MKQLYTILFSVLPPSLLCFSKNKKAATKDIVLLLTAICYLSFAHAQTLVAYYPLNGNAKDSSGNRFNGTISGGVSFAAVKTDKNTVTSRKLYVSAVPNPVASQLNIYINNTSKEFVDAKNALDVNAASGNLSKATLQVTGIAGNSIISKQVDALNNKIWCSKSFAACSRRISC